jgi:hypothetical protein
VEPQSIEGIGPNMGALIQRWIQAMRTGEYETAWSLAQEVAAARDPATRDDPAQPFHLRWVWDGQPVEGRHVLVRCYRGLGDTLQFARYLPLLAERAASVTVEAQPGLVPLLRGLSGVTKVLPFDPARPLPPSECDIEITELDFALRLPPEAGESPYLRVSKAPLPEGTIGLCYRAGDWDPARSIPSEMMGGLCAHRPCLTLVAEPTSLPVLNPAGCPLDMTVTASLVAAVDLVVTVDTMIAHLAGAMGKRAWLLLKAEPDWRWDPHARRSAWYPSLRLFAQPRAGDWAPVVAEIERELTRGDFDDDEPAEPVGARVLG